MSYKSPELDEAIEQARRRFDEGRADEALAQVPPSCNEDQPYTFLFFRKSLAFLDWPLRQHPSSANSE